MVDCQLTSKFEGVWGGHVSDENLSVPTRRIWATITQQHRAATVKPTTRSPPVCRLSQGVLTARCNLSCTLSSIAARQALYCQDPLTSRSCDFFDLPIMGTEKHKRAASVGAGHEGVESLGTFQQKTFTIGPPLTRMPKGNPADHTCIG